MLSECFYLLLLALGWGSHWTAYYYYIFSNVGLNRVLCTRVCAGEWSTWVRARSFDIAEAAPWATARNTRRPNSFDPRVASFIMRIFRQLSGMFYINQSSSLSSCLFNKPVIVELLIWVYNAVVSNGLSGINICWSASNTVVLPARGLRGAPNDCIVIYDRYFLHDLNVWDLYVLRVHYYHDSNVT